MISPDSNIFVTSTLFGSQLLFFGFENSKVRKMIHPSEKIKGITIAIKYSFSASTKADRYQARKASDLINKLKKTLVMVASISSLTPA